MNSAARIAAFVALLAAIFAGAALAGGALGPDGGSGAKHAGADADAHDAAPAADHGDPGRRAGAATAEDTPPAGVSSSQDGLRLVADRTHFTTRLPMPLHFRIVGADGETVRAFETEQARRMHLIVVRRDLRRYQHLHPVQRPGGAWTIAVTLPDAGVYRAFADFRTAGEQHTLGVDLFAAGDFRPLELPTAAALARVDGYDVTVHEHDGESGFTVRRDGRVVEDLQPYLGARGHLVVLRAGDLAYQHVHPTAASPPQVAFHTGTAQPGSYRLFLQFRHRGRVHTAAFTRVVAP